MRADSAGENPSASSAWQRLLSSTSELSSLAHDWSAGAARLAELGPAGARGWNVALLRNVDSAAAAASPCVSFSGVRAGGAAGAGVRASACAGAAGGGEPGAGAAAAAGFGACCGCSSCCGEHGGPARSSASGADGDTFTGGTGGVRAGAAGAGDAGVGAAAAGAAAGGAAAAANANGTSAEASGAADAAAACCSGATPAQSCWSTRTLHLLPHAPMRALLAFEARLSSGTLLSFTSRKVGELWEHKQSDC